MDETTVKRVVIGIFVFLLLGFVTTKNENALKGIVVAFVLMAPFVAAWYINNPVEIRQRREKIREYRPGEWTDRDAGEGFETPRCIRLGVFGVQNSGKSAFLNSLFFALKGVWAQEYVEGAGNTEGGETIFREPRRLTNHVTTIDTRGLVDFSTKRVPDVISEIRGQRAINPRLRARGELIDCPIFILRYSPTMGIQHCFELLRSLVPEIREQLGAYPIMVVTFAKNIDKSNKEGIVDDIVQAGMERGSVFFVENYTVRNHGMDSKKDIELLQILEACIKRADDNITFRWRKKNEPSGFWFNFKQRFR